MIETTASSMGPTAFAGLIWLVVGLVVAVFVYILYAILQETGLVKSDRVV